MIFDEEAGPAGPAGVLREQLAEAREAGCSFGEAWPGALEEALCSANGTRSEWHVVLEGMVWTWQREYERRPVAAGGVVELDAGPARACEWCGASIEHRRVTARFCGPACYNAMLRAGRRQRLGTPARCENCGAPIEGRRADAIACSTRCAHALRYQARREREKGPRLTACVVCEGSLAHKRAGSEVCSPKCRRVREKRRLGEKRQQQQLVAA